MEELLKAFDKAVDEYCDNADALIEHTKKIIEEY